MRQHKLHVLRTLTALLLVPPTAMRATEKPATSSTPDTATLAAAATAAQPAARRPWSAERAWDWYRQYPWLVGFNYVPRTACNTTEWWQKETFDPATIDREFGWAEKLGFNTTRAFIQYLVWKHDPDGFRQRFAAFLELADKHGLTVMPVLFDDCAFGDPALFDPSLGRQRDPIPGMILPSWTPSPGRKLAADPTERSLLKRYVQDLVRTFGRDRRIIAWDLFNEPMNVAATGRAEWLREIFAWAREAVPQQPLTISVWNDNREINPVLLGESDVTSFHLYANCAAMWQRIADLKQLGRPVICTEWMARLQGSRWDADLPLFKAEGVACYNWGLVNGRTQCQFAWYHKRGTPEPMIWFHDLFHADGRPYDASEHAAIRQATADKRIDWSANDYGTMRTPRPAATGSTPAQPRMLYGDATRHGRPLAKDPSVIRLGERYLMYYSTGWTCWRGAGPRGGGLHYANQPGRRAEIAFRGTGLTLIHKTGLDCGIAHVLVDGQPATIAALDTYSAKVDWNHHTVVAQGLPPGEHTVSILVTDRRNERSSNAYLQIVGYQQPAESPTP